MKGAIIAVLLMIQPCAAITAEEKYPLVKEGNSYVCTGAEPCKLDENTTFGSAMLWMMDHNIDAEKNALKSDVSKKSIGLNYTISEDESADKTFSFHLDMEVKDGKIAFLVKDVKCTPKGVIGMFKTLSFDKMNLTKKPQYKEYVDKFAVLCDKFMQTMLTEIINADIKLNNWNSIVEGKVVKGMTANEVKLAMGIPLSITENSQRTMWSYVSGAVVMFEKGVVTGVIN